MAVAPAAYHARTPPTYYFSYADEDAQAFTHHRLSGVAHDFGDVLQKATRLLAEGWRPHAALRRSQAAGSWRARGIHRPHIVAGTISA